MRDCASKGKGPHLVVRAHYYLPDRMTKSDKYIGEFGTLCMFDYLGCSMNNCLCVYRYVSACGIYSVPVLHKRQPIPLFSELVSTDPNSTIYVRTVWAGQRPPSTSRNKPLASSDVQTHLVAGCIAVHAQGVVLLFFCSNQLIFLLTPVSLSVSSSVFHSARLW